MLDLCTTLVCSPPLSNPETAVHVDTVHVTVLGLLQAIDVEASILNEFSIWWYNGSRPPDHETTRQHLQYSASASEKIIYCAISPYSHGHHKCTTLSPLRPHYAHLVLAGAAFVSSTVDEPDMPDVTSEADRHYSGPSGMHCNLTLRKLYITWMLKFQAQEHRASLQLSLCIDED